MDDVKTVESPQAAETAQPVGLTQTGQSAPAEETAQPAETSKAAGPAAVEEGQQFTKLGEDIGVAAAAQPAKSSEATQGPEALRPMELGGSRPRKFPDFAKIPQRTWLIAATAGLTVITLLTLSVATRRTPAAKAVPVERTVESVTPEAVMAACGQPAADVTKDLYPMIKRTMTYRPEGKSAVVMEFSRTAEEHSQWVFLSMKDEDGANRYESPETQIPALPCLGQKK
jgi:hypothetical protein